MLIRLAARAGGASPQTSLISASAETICPASTSRAARTERHFGAPIPRHSSPTRTSSGPSSRNLIITRDHSPRPSGTSLNHDRSLLRPALLAESSRSRFSQAGAPQAPWPSCRVQLVRRRLCHRCDNRRKINMHGNEHAPPGVCIVCGQPVTKVANTVLDEWAWAGADGRTTGPMPDLAHLEPDPHSYLAGLAGRMDAARAARKASLTPLYWATAREYSALKTRLEVGATFHQHIARTAPWPAGKPVSWCCGWPGRLRPSGWRCRQCGAALAGERAAGPIL